jgi:hypothetical protein
VKGFVCGALVWGFARAFLGEFRIKVAKFIEYKAKFKQRLLSE